MNGTTERIPSRPRPRIMTDIMISISVIPCLRSANFMVKTFILSVLSKSR